MSIEEKLENLIVSKYGSIAEFSRTVNIADPTIRSMLKRGVKKAHINTLFPITKELGIDAESLFFGEIVFLEDLKNDLRRKVDTFISELSNGQTTINGDAATKEEILEITEYLNFATTRVIYNRERRNENDT